MIFVFNGIIKYIYILMFLLIHFTIFLHPLYLPHSFTYFLLFDFPLDLWKLSFANYLFENNSFFFFSFSGYWKSVSELAYRSLLLNNTITSSWIV